MEQHHKLLVSSIKLLVVALLLVGVSACKGNKEQPILEVDPSFGEYVSAYTSGLVSAQSVITIKLTQPVDGFTSEGKEIDTKLFEFNPTLKGKAYWQNNYTVIFRPEEPMKSGEHYTASFKVGSLFDVKESRLKYFDFSFRVIPQTLSVEFDGLEVENRENPNTYNLMGTVIAADVVAEADLLKCISIKYNGREVPVEISESTLQNTFKMVARGIERESKQGSVIVAWTAKPIGGTLSNSESFDVPKLGNYKVTSTAITQAPNQSVTFVFSDLIDPQQDFRGLVEFDDKTNIRFEVDRNKLKIYPEVQVEGVHKIKVDQSVKNILGDRLDEEFETSFVFEEIKPSVRAVNKGAILPTTEGLVFPFEAVNLKSVLVEVIKIFENNIPYYLQVNQLGESDELNRVGYPVLKKVVDLNQVGVVVPNRWERYTLDLKSLFVSDPGAIYQIKISFNKHQLLTPCEGVESKPIDESIDASQFVEPGYYSDYYYDYDDNYDWRLRDDPCNSAYYSDERRIKRCILSSDIGIIAKLGNNGEMVVAVNDIPTAKPQMGAAVKVTDYQNQVIAEGSTNSEGLIDLTLTRQPFLVTVSIKEQKGYLRVDNASSNSLSNFDVGGVEIQKGIKGMIYGERGIWRPGDTLHLCFMVEDKNSSIPVGHPVVFELTDARGIVVKKMVQSHSDVGINYFPVATDAQAPTGNWRATVKVGGATFTKSIKVESIKPNRLKLNLNLKNQKIPLSGNIDATLNVKWLHGAVASNMRAIYEISASKAKATFPNHGNFDFDDPGISYPSQTSTLWEGTTDANGSAHVSGEIPSATEMPAAINVLFKGRVFEPGGDFSINLQSEVYKPFKEFVGLQLPTLQPGHNWLETDKDHPLTIATVDEGGNPVSCDNLVVELYKTTWRWWWEQPQNGDANYVSHDYNSLVQRTLAKTENGRGTASIRIDYPQWGRYYVRVVNRDNGNSCGSFVYFDWGYDTGKSQGERPGGSSILSLSTDKLTYRVEEDIKLTFSGMKNARALISIENGSRVLSSYWVDAGSATNVVAIRVLPSMTPNIYVHVTLLQPHSDKENDLPIRLFGIVPLTIHDPQTILKPIITMPNELKSESAVSILVRENSGRKMNFTLAVVDEGLLDINSFKTPNPYSVFYAREAIGVKTWDLYNDVIGAYGGKIERLLSIGGDESLNPTESNQNLRFKPVVRFFGPFTVENGRSHKIDFNLPNYVGSVRVMVIGCNKGAYGFAEQSCPVRNDVMVMATLPRVLGPSEELMIPVNVFVSNDEIEKVNVKIKTSDNLELIDGNSKSVKFDGESEKMVFFKCKVGNQCGPAKVEISADGKNAHSKQEIDIEIRNPMQETTRSMSVVIPADTSLRFKFSTFGVENSNSVELEASVVPPLNIEKRLKQLIAYPHGCLEQTVSSVFPQLYLKDLVDLTDKQQEQTASNIDEAIKKLGRLQNPSGGFRYWPNSTTTDEWSTTYAGHFLLEARYYGYEVPQNIIESWLTYQRQLARQYSAQSSDEYRHQLVQAYRLYTLAMAQKPEVGAMNKLKGQNLELPAKMRLAAAYALIGQHAVAEKLVENTPFDVQEYRELGYTYGSNLRDRAIVLEALLLMNQQAQAFPIVVELSNNIASNNWLSTQETATILNALAKIAVGDGKKSNLALKYKLNRHSETLRSDKPIIRTQLKANDGENEIEIINEMKDKVFANIITTGIPPLGAEEPFNNNLNLSVKYELNDGTNINPAHIKQGIDFVCAITIYNPGIRGELKGMALTQIFPSGWEIGGIKLDENSSDVARFDYQDIRDDRVLTYFDLKPNQSKTFRIKLTATYAGRFYMPGAYCEAMYDGSISALQSGGWVVVE